MQLEETVDYLHVSDFQQKKNKDVVTDDQYGILLTLLNLTPVKNLHFCEGWIGW